MRINTRITWRGNLATRLAREAAKQGMGEAAEHILRVANDEYTPIDEGTLVRSGNTDVEVTAQGAKSSVYYDTPYATRLHERPEYNFQNGRQGKFLEKAIEQEKDSIERYLADRYREYFS